MPQQFTPVQAEELKKLGIEVNPEDIKTESLPVKRDVEQSETEGLKQPEISNQPIVEIESSETAQIQDNHPVKGDVEPPEKKSSSVFPLLSISGLTLLSFGGLVLLKGNSSKPTTNPSNVSAPNQSSSELSPTQVPKSIQHYLLTSQQYFSQAVQQQSSTADSQSKIELLNNSILAATEAIKEFPDDYRGYQQRGTIYQALIDSKPELINQSISDFSTAFKLNSNSAEVTRSLATLYAKKGDANKTIAFLNQTVALEPTKVQNFYDLAKIQQQAGLLAQALDTYNKLIPLITDPTQKATVESEKSSLEKLVAQNPNSSSDLKYGQTDVSAPDTNNLSPSLDSPTIQASTGTGLIIAAPEEDSSIKVTNQTDSNSLSGNAILPSGQKEITISNDNISSTSQVYVTITKGGKNQNFQVTSKSDKSFTAGLDSSISKDVEFKWWIIN